jgi:hypothetical protein
MIFIWVFFIQIQLALVVKKICDACDVSSCENRSQNHHCYWIFGKQHDFCFEDRLDLIQNDKYEIYLN